MRALRWIVVAVALVVAACGQDETAPPSTRSHAATEPLSGTAGPAARAERPAPESAPIEGAAFVVEVTDAQGATVPGAAVAAYSLWDAPDAGSGDAPAARGGTDSSGRATLASLATGRWRLVADARGFARGEADAAWAEGDPPTRVAIVLHAGESLDVTVRRFDGAPLTGAGVVVAAPGARIDGAPAARTWRGTTDASGVCRVAGLPRGAYDVRLDVEPPREDCLTAVRVPEVARIDLVVPETGVIEGRVVDENGVPVAGAQVRAWDEDWAGRTGAPHRLVAETTSGPDGAFRADARRPDVSVAFVEARAPSRGRSATPVGGRSLRAGDTLDGVLLVLRPEAVVHGVVATPNEPVGGAEVTVWRPLWTDSDRWLRESTRTAADGTWRMSGLSEETLIVTVRAGGFAQADAESFAKLIEERECTDRELKSIPAHAQVDVAPGVESRLDVRMIRVPVEPVVEATLAGRVRREDGSAVPGADVRATGARGGEEDVVLARTVTRADGTFRLTAASAGDIDLTARTADGARSHVVVALGNAASHGTVEIVVRPGPLIRGVVRSLDGRPLAGALVSAGRAHERSYALHVRWNATAPARTGPDGAYVLPVVWRDGEPASQDRWDCVVRVVADGHAPALSPTFEEFDVDDAGECLDFDFVLGPGATLTGRVCDDAGAPISGAAIALAAPHESGATWPPVALEASDGAVVARSGADGAFRIEHVAAGTFALTASAPGRFPETVEVTSPATAPADVRLVRALEISGAVATADGAPADDVWVVLQNDPGQFPATAVRRTDARGGFRFTGVRDGRCFLTVFTGTSAHAEREVAQSMHGPVPAGSTGLRIVLPRPRRVEGVLLDAAGAPVAGATIEARPIRAGPLLAPVLGPVHGPDAETDAQGSFVLERLGIERHRLLVRTQRNEFDLGVYAHEFPAELRLPGSALLAGKLRWARQTGDEETLGATLAARRLGPDGRPSEMPQDCQVDDRGAFAFRHLAPGRYLVDLAPRRAGYVAGDALYTISLRAPVLLDAGTTDAVIDVELTRVVR